MLPSVTRWLGLVAATAPLALAGGHDDIISRDVVIIGGGAAGAHAAVRLRDDYHKSVAVIEKQSIMGGHVNSYDDSTTGESYDYGVQSFVDVGNAREFFERFDVEVGSPGRASVTTEYVDFTTGKVLDYQPPPTEAQTEALKKYLVPVEKYEHMLHPGYDEFPHGKDIPEDLLMPFHEFLEKYDCKDALPVIWRTTGHGAGDIMNQMTMWVFQIFGGPLTRSFLGLQDSFKAMSGRNQDLYDAIQEHLGDDVLLDTTVIDTKRGKDGVFLKVWNSKTEEVTLVMARRLLIAIQPTMDNMATLDMSRKEGHVFSKINYFHMYAGLVTNDALPANTSLFNLPEAAQPDHVDVLPTPSFVPRFDYFGQDLFRFMFIGKEDVNEEEAKQIMQGYLQALIDGGAIPEPEGSNELEFPVMADHGLMGDTVRAEDLKDDWMHHFYRLQGHRSTWFTGAAFTAPYQTSIWAWNDIMLPKLVHDLERP